MCQEGKAKSCRLKKILEFLGKNSPNPLDKPHKVWYNEYVKRGTQRDTPLRIGGNRNTAN
jgi:hypothetical protein